MIRGMIGGMPGGMLDRVRRIAAMRDRTQNLRQRRPQPRRLEQLTQKGRGGNMMMPAEDMGYIASQVLPRQLPEGMIPAEGVSRPAMQVLPRPRPKLESSGIGGFTGWGG